MGIRENCSNGATAGVDMMHSISVGNIVKYPLSIGGGIIGFVIGSLNLAVRKSGILSDRGDFKEQYDRYKRSEVSSLSTHTGPLASAGIAYDGIAKSFSSTISQRAVGNEGQGQEPEGPAR